MTNDAQILQNQQENATTNQVKKKSNGLGLTGFIIAIVALFLGWVPVLGWIIWVLGLIFSFIGVFKKPKGLAIAGLVISLICIILLIFVFGSILSMAK